MRARRSFFFFAALASALVVLNTTSGVSARFDLFGLGKKKSESAKDEESITEKAPEPTRDVSEAEQLPEIDARGSQTSRPVLSAKPMSPAMAALSGISKPVQARGGGKRPDLDAIRDALNDVERLKPEEQSRGRSTPKRPSLFGYDGDNNGGVQGNRRGRGKSSDQSLAPPPPGLYDDDDDEDDDDYEYDEFNDGAQPRGQEDKGGLFERFTNHKVRAELAAKYVRTNRGVSGNETSLSAADRARQLIEFSLVHKKKSKPGEQGQVIGGQAGVQSPASVQLNKMKQGFKSALKITKKGLKGGARVLSELPKYVQEATDSLNAFMQLDGKGKLLAMINEVNANAQFVRGEFSRFTLSWSPIMERALDYLGDQNLDKLKWNDNDELDMRRDALHSLVFGYEFMRLMIMWRENLLIAHEAFKFWLESMRVEVEAKRVELDENLIIQLRTTHSFMLLTSWMNIQEAGRESRTKLDHLMEIEDDRPKNYESEFFRNILVLQEMYDPTREEFERERDQVVSTISVSGVLAENLKDVEDFFVDFRNKLASHEIIDIDWEVPEELTSFLAMLEPQLRRSTLVYSKGFLTELGLR